MWRWCLYAIQQGRLEPMATPALNELLMRGGTGGLRDLMNAVARQRAGPTIDAMPQQTLGFIFDVDTSGLDVQRTQLQAVGRGESLAECLGDALNGWARNQRELAERFTMETTIHVGDPPEGVS